MGVRSERRPDGTLWVTFTPDGRRPPLLTPEVFDRLDGIIAQAEAEDPAAVVFTGEEGGDFQAGVELESFASISSRQEAHAASRRGQSLFQRIADLPCPTLAVIEGRCIGGGLELALACSARLAADEEDTAFACPEIHIGIIPGFGGTQRLPRRIGQRRALEMVLTGRRVGTEEAFRIGLVDRIASPGRLGEESANLLQEILGGAFRARGPRLLSRPADLVLEGLPPVRRLVRNRYLKAVRRRTAGRFPAPEAAITAIGWGASRLPIGEGLEREADLLADLIAGDVHRHLLGIVRARQRLRSPRSARQAGGSGGAGWAIEPGPEAATRLSEILTSPPGTPSRPAPTGETPTLELAGGYGLLRRLPGAVGTRCCEVVWVPAAGPPDGFFEAARSLLTSAHITPVWCYLAEPSPGLNLLAAYLREGERLVAGGRTGEWVDRILQSWGMARGPVRMAADLRSGWGSRLEDLPARRLPDPIRRGGQQTDAGTDAESHLVEEVVAALALQIARDWDVVAEPTAAGWTALDCFVLGGPPFRGGVLGAAREYGEDLMCERLEALADRRGLLYAPAPLIERGILRPQGPPDLDEILSG